MYMLNKSGPNMEPCGIPNMIAAHSLKQLLIYTHTYTHTHTYTCIHMHACMHACIHTYMHACMHACMHTYIHNPLSTLLLLDTFYSTHAVCCVQYTF